VEYKKVNDARKGTKGEQGSYMLQFGALIKRIQQHQGNHDVFFLAENVVLDNDGNAPLEEGMLKQVKNAFGTGWSLTLDSMCFSPVYRKRTYLFNFPVSAKDTDYFNETNPVYCLQDGYQHVVHITRPHTFVKANCFMASKSKIDDDRMIVVEKVKKKFLKQRTINTPEREDMMGYPKGYVEQPGMSFVCDDWQYVCCIVTGFLTTPVLACSQSPFHVSAAGWPRCKITSSTILEGYLACAVSRLWWRTNSRV
jgi:hypothetical protein